MGLITKEVEVLVSGNMSKYYESLGYIIPRRIDPKGRNTVPSDTKIMIKVGDLSKGSRKLVDVQCDHCGKIYPIRYYQYLQRVKDGKTYCANCYGRVHSGKNNPLWNHDLSEEERVKQRDVEGYNDFIRDVMIRDNFTCQRCKQYSGRLNVHHLNGYNWYIDGRMDVDNAITLCENCHKNFHSHYGFKNNTKEQFEDWIIKDIEISNTNKNPITTKQIFCIEENKIYESASELAKEWGLSNANSIYALCNQNILKRDMPYDNEYALRKNVKGKHLLWYEDYLKMNDEDILLYLRKSKPDTLKSVLCITTGYVFDSISNAQKYYNASSHISDCCTGKRKFCGKLSDGTPLQWMYYEDYLEQNNITDEEAKQSLFFVA